MDDGKMQGNYSQFFLMILASMLVMYLLTYTNSWDIWGTAYFSETRLFMVLMMGGAMAIIMLTFMSSMYANAKANASIYIGAVILMGVALTLVRSQATV